MTIDKEFEAFRAMMLSQFARLAENAGRYVGRMSNDDREEILYDALEFAWLQSASFDPLKDRLPSYWDFCLRDAIRVQGLVRLRCTADWETVPSDVFLTCISPVGVPTDE